MLQRQSEKVREKVTHGEGKSGKGCNMWQRRTNKRRAERAQSVTDLQHHNERLISDINWMNECAQGFDT